MQLLPLNLQFVINSKASFWSLLALHDLGGQDLSCSL